MTNAHVINSSANLPPVLDLRALQANFGLGKTTAYLLASSGDIQSLTLGAPSSKRGKRVFLTESVLDYIKRRLETSKPLHCGRRETTTAQDT